jgi:glycosyltransferase involved in cell wall biosynthesis
MVPKETKGHNPTFDLSVVIPIGGVSNDYSKLELNILAASEFHFQVVLVLDGLLHSQREQIVNFVESSYPEFKNVSFYETNFQNPGAARNFGLNHASGKFITFWDSDDLANCSKIAESLTRIPEKIDAVIGAFQQIDLEDSPSTIFRTNRWSWRVDLLVNPGFWRILYRRDRLGSAQFGKSRMGEDQVFLARFGIWNRKVAISDEIFYTYFVGNPNQLTRARNRFKELRATIHELKTLDKNQNFVNVMFIYFLVIRLRVSLFKAKVFREDND